MIGISSEYCSLRWKIEGMFMIELFSKQVVQLVYSLCFLCIMNSGTVWMYAKGQTNEKDYKQKVISLFQNINDRVIHSSAKQVLSVQTVIRAELRNKNTAVQQDTIRGFIAGGLSDMWTANGRILTDGRRMISIIPYTKTIHILKVAANDNTDLYKQATGMFNRELLNSAEVSQYHDTIDSQFGAVKVLSISIPSKHQAKTGIVRIEIMVNKECSRLYSARIETVPINACKAINVRYLEMEYKDTGRDYSSLDNLIYRNKAKKLLHSEFQGYKIVE